MAARRLLPRRTESRARLRRCLPYMRDGGCRMTRVRTIAGVLELLRRWFNDNRRTRAFWRFSHRPERCACAAPVGAEAAVPVEVPDFRMAWTVIDMVPADN
jgi:hypothetical protein